MYASSQSEFSLAAFCMCVQKVKQSFAALAYWSLQSLYTNALHCSIMRSFLIEIDTSMTVTLDGVFLDAAPLFIPASPHYHSINLIQLSMARRWRLNSYTFQYPHCGIHITRLFTLLCKFFSLSDFIFCYYYWWCVVVAAFCRARTSHINTKTMPFFIVDKSHQIFSLATNFVLMPMQFQ